MDGWVGGWVDGWMEAKAGLRIAYSNQKVFWPYEVGPFDKWGVCQSAQTEPFGNFS